MAHFYGGASQLHRQLKGLLLPGLPRGQIPGRTARGLPLTLAVLQLDSSGLQEPVPDPIGQGPAVLLCRSLKQLLVLIRQPQLDSGGFGDFSHTDSVRKDSGRFKAQAY